MKKFAILLLVMAFACTVKRETESSIETSKPEFVIAPNFRLIKAHNQRGLLILFPCFPCDSEHTLSEFNIEDVSTNSGFSVLAMNFNQRLFLSLDEKQDLEKQLTEVIREHNLHETNIFVGGFSSGGNVSLLLCDYLSKSKSRIQPKGVFIVDSPVDLLGLYKASVKNIELQLSEESAQESVWIKSFFDSEFGSPTNGIVDYEKNSPYTFETQNIQNLESLKHLKIRFYSEPDLKWWEEYAHNGYEDLNAFYIQKLADKLKMTFGNTNVEFIKTEGRGYRKNGQRHPHSWSIVNEGELIKWMIQ